MCGMWLRMVSSLRMQAIKATFFGLCQRRKAILDAAEEIYAA